MATLFGILKGHTTKAYRPFVPVPSPTPGPDNRTILEAARRESICRLCEQWDAEKEGCSRFTKCDRHGLTRVYWRQKNYNGCRLGRWQPPA